MFFTRVRHYRVLLNYYHYNICVLMNSHDVTTHYIICCVCLYNMYTRYTYIYHDTKYRSTLGIYLLIYRGTSTACLLSSIRCIFKAPPQFAAKRVFRKKKFHSCDWYRQLWLATGQPKFTLIIPLIPCS